MTDNVLDISTRKPLEKRKRAKYNKAQKYLKDVIDAIEGETYVSVSVCLIDKENEHMTYFDVEPEHFAVMCVALGSMADEMGDLSLGFDDLED